MIKFLKRCPVCLNESLRPLGQGSWSCPQCGARMTLTSMGLTTRPGRRLNLDRRRTRPVAGTTTMRWMAPDSGTSTGAPEPICSRCSKTALCSECEAPMTWGRPSRVS